MWSPSITSHKWTRTPFPWSRTSSRHSLTGSRLRNLTSLKLIKNSCSTTIHVRIQPSRTLPLYVSTIWCGCQRTPWSHSWETYLMSASDILVTGESETAHLQNLAALLERLESAGIRLKREECSFMISEVEYLGHSISAKGIQKVRAIRDAPRPQDILHLRSFLGMLNYYRKFLPNLATLSMTCSSRPRHGAGGSPRNRPSVRPRSYSRLHLFSCIMTPRNRWYCRAMPLYME